MGPLHLPLALDIPVKMAWVQIPRSGAPRQDMIDPRAPGLLPGVDLGSGAAGAGEDLVEAVESRLVQ